MSGVASPAVTEALERFTRALRERFGERLAEVVLFGSYARGEANEDSDVDVFVAIDDLSDRERLTVFDVAYDSGRRVDEWIGLSPLVYSSAHATRMRKGGRRLFRDIDAEGVRL